MKPLQKLFALVLDDLWMSYHPPKRNKVKQMSEKIAQLSKEITDEQKLEKKIMKLKEKEVEELIFRNYLRQTNNVKNGNQSITKFFQTVSSSSTATKK